MTNHVARLYAIALSLVIFFLFWAAVAAAPWSPEQTAASPNPQVAALDRRAKKLERERVRVQRMLDRRFAEYRVQLRKRQQQIAQVQASAIAAASTPSVAAPSVGTVSAPPVTSTKSS